MDKSRKILANLSIPPYTLLQFQHLFQARTGRGERHVAVVGTHGHDVAILFLVVHMPLSVVWLSLFVLQGDRYLTVGSRGIGEVSPALLTPRDLRRNKRSAWQRY